MSVLFSIIIPTLNEEKYLPHLLSDIDHQITKEYEVLVVDAASTDKTKEKALEKLALFCLKWKSSYKGLSKQFLKEYNKF